ncbi:MAG: hypothetical protein WKG06_38900 [Segetibacter sp.]
MCVLILLLCTEQGIAGDDPFEQRVKSWRDMGYQLDFMTGIAWGSHDDYFLGKWDGKNQLGVKISW